MCKELKALIGDHHSLNPEFLQPGIDLCHSSQPRVGIGTIVSKNQIKVQKMGLPSQHDKLYPQNLLMSIAGLTMQKYPMKTHCMLHASIQNHDLHTKKIVFMSLDDDKNANMCSNTSLGNEFILLTIVIIITILIITNIPHAYTIQISNPIIDLEIQGKTKTSYLPSNAPKPTKIKNKQKKYG